ncbi:MAG: lamin tail domain-containing protein, partial [Verrucomicrobiota bacterium]
RGAPAGAIRINEVMADNETTVMDELGAYSDWFELYNAGSNTVDLSGYTMSDNLDNPDKWMIPTGTLLAAGAHLLIWADGSSVSNAFALDANFKLRRSGDELALYNPQGVLLDGIAFDEMCDDISLGVFPDGGSILYDMAAPTPGTTNRLFEARVSGASSNGTLTIRWYSRPGWRYNIYYRDQNFDEVPWILSETNIMADGERTEWIMPIPPDAQRRYFRIERQATE